MCEMAFHFLLDSHEFISECFFDILSFHGEHGLKSVFFRLENLDLLLMEVHFVLDAFDSFL